MTVRSSRGGVALFLALAAIVVIGLVVASSYFGASLRNKVAANSLALAAAHAVGDYAENSTFLQAASLLLDSLAVGASSAPVTHQPPGNGEAVVSITRLQSNMYMMFTRAAPSSLAASSLVRTSILLFRFKLSAPDGGDPSEVTAYPVRVTHRSWAEVYR